MGTDAVRGMEWSAGEIDGLDKLRGGLNAILREAGRFPVAPATAPIRGLLFDLFDHASKVNAAIEAWKGGRHLPRLGARRWPVLLRPPALLERARPRGIRQLSGPHPHPAQRSRPPLSPTGSSKGADTMSHELPAGRELDALVAERVMGATWRTSGHAEYEVLVLEGSGTLCSRHRETGEISETWNRHGCWWAYSEDIEAAWAVMEKMAARWDVSLGRLHNIECWEGPTMWECHVGDLVKYEENYRARAETAPHAICLAAIEAARVQEAKS